jgi:FAD/FMN-containing dehydrogenase
MNHVIEQLRNQLGDNAVLTGAEIGARYYSDWSGYDPQAPIAVVRPATVGEVSTVVKLCSAASQPIVVQGGMTGLCGGASPRAGEIALSLERLNGIEELDSDSMTLTVLAGTPLQVIQEAAEEAGFMFPLDLGARGSCNIGGNISTNAGGNQVVRFGMTRNLVLGLEVVLPDGTILSSMNKMLKNNAGYDLKHLFIGTEGTLGIVTRAVLRLFPKLNSCCTALCALNTFPDVVGMLHRAGSEFGGSLSTFELMWSTYVDYILQHVSSARLPFGSRYPLYLLLEIEGSDQSKDGERFEEVLGACLESGLIIDAAIAQSTRDAEGFWAIRDGVAELGPIMHALANFDVSLPISRMEAFLEQVSAELSSRFGEHVFAPFGHIGDSNLHLIVSTGNKDDVPTIYEMVYAAIRQHEGSISAEHGIGILKRDHLGQSRSEEEIELMKRLKATLDPRGILNSGRVIS